MKLMRFFVVVVIFIIWEILSGKTFSRQMSDHGCLDSTVAEIVALTTVVL